MRSKKINELTENEVYKRYLSDGVNNLSTKELLELIDILYALGKNCEVIDVAEYTLSLIDMGIDNDFIDEELNEWLDNSFEKEEYDDAIPYDDIFPGEELDYIEEQYNNKEKTQEDNEEGEEEEEDNASDNIETLRESIFLNL